MLGEEKFRGNFVFNTDKFSVKAPESFSELIENLNNIVGKNYKEIAEFLDVKLPKSSLHAKGWAGQAIELCLGASAKSAAVPDFPNLGLELKTIPVDENHKPLESTFLSYAPLMSKNTNFYDSCLYSKISRMLFVLVCATREMAMSRRFVVGYFFWEPSAEEIKLIKDDYDELMEMVKTGYVENITARIGTVIQMRPKCANGKKLTACVGPSGNLISTRPRGFYMRRKFSSMLIEKYWLKSNPLVIV